MITWKEQLFSIISEERDNAVVGQFIRSILPFSLSSIKSRFASESEEAIERFLKVIWCAKSEKGRTEFLPLPVRIVIPWIPVTWRCHMLCRLEYVNFQK